VLEINFACPSSLASLATLNATTNYKTMQEAPSIFFCILGEVVKKILIFVRAVGNNLMKIKLFD
jgi:hypothetical protein